MKYRSEIDGLRALAVIPVIFFHAGFEAFRGGYIGVDVFFVISGYLITTILINSLEEKNFSLIDFYLRRARRILPALFLIMLICIPFAWMWMLPYDLKNFSQSLVAVTFFASNFLFTFESGYFDSQSENKPLLHTWSLAVEEQYYLIFPIFLFLCWKFGKNKIFWFIVILTSISFIINEWGWRNKPIANFFLAPSRIWEIFAGSIAALIIKNKGIKNNDTCSILGLTIIIFSIVLYNKDIPYPSFYALPPVVGTMLIILYTDKTSLISKILSNRFIVGIGLISYSTYLWHQPIFSFARIRLLEEPSKWIMILLSMMSLSLAYISWRWVEKPFRSKSLNFKKSYFIGILFLCISFFLFFGFIGHKTNGFEDRKAADHLPSDFYKFATLAKVNPDCIDSITPCKLSSNSNNFNKILLIGDSHSVDYHFDFIKESIDRNLSPYQYSTGGCGFFAIQYESCKSKIEILKKIIEDNSFEKIILINDLYGHASKDEVNDTNWQNYESLITYLADKTDQLFIFQPRKHINSSKAIQNIIYQKTKMNRFKSLENEELVNKFYIDISNNLENLYLFNQSKSINKLVDNSDNFSAMSIEGYALYKDSNHVTPYTTKFVFRDFLKNYVLK